MLVVMPSHIHMYIQTKQDVWIKCNFMYVNYMLNEVISKKKEILKQADK